MNANHVEQIAENASKSDAVAIAKVKSVGPSPQAWSGLLATYQEVHYQAVRWLKKPPNETKGDTIAVFHPLVAKSLTADDHYPKLRESLFRVGAEVMLFLRLKDSRMETFNENSGVVLNDPKVEEAVIHALERHPAKP